MSRQVRSEFTKYPVCLPHASLLGSIDDKVIINPEQVRASYTRAFVKHLALVRNLLTVTTWSARCPNFVAAPHVPNELANVFND